MVTINLSRSETSRYAGAVRQNERVRARLLAAKLGKRFAQIVGADGKILDCVEVFDGRKAART